MYSCNYKPVNKRIKYLFSIFHKHWWCSSLEGIGSKSPVQIVTDFRIRYNNELWETLNKMNLRSALKSNGCAASPMLFGRKKMIRRRGLPCLLKRTTSRNICSVTNLWQPARRMCYGKPKPLIGLLTTNELRNLFILAPP